MSPHSQHNKRSQLTLGIDVNVNGRVDHNAWCVMCFTRIVTTVSFHNFRNKKCAGFVIYSSINLRSWAYWTTISFPYDLHCGFIDSTS